MAEKKTKAKKEAVSKPVKKYLKSTKSTTKKVIDKKSSETKKESKLIGDKIIQYAVGRRKRAVARVRMYSGSGEVIINGKNIEEYTPSKAKLVEFMKPLVASGVADTHSFTVKVVGGGIAGQLEAARHGISRCIAKVNDDLKKTMKQGGFLTRDPREKERKKVYHVRARKSPQYSKR
jgi:small subunit ribosomal protein S9